MRERLKRDAQGKPVCKCGSPGNEPRTCPYRADIHSDPKTLCTCCNDCRRECADDI